MWRSIILFKEPVEYIFDKRLRYEIFLRHIAIALNRCEWFSADDIPPVLETFTHLSFFKRKGVVAPKVGGFITLVAIKAIIGSSTIGKSFD